MKPHKPCNCEVCEKARYSIPCSDGSHSSFWKVVVESKEWELWEKEVSRRMNRHNKNHSKIYKGVWDVDECRECGWISPEHFRDFLKFVKKIKCPSKS